MRNDEIEIGDDLTITKTTRRAAGAGTWVCGRLNGHRFDALVFSKHAENPEFELGESRISKLWIQRLADKAEVINFDRGWDVQPVTDEAAAIVDFLCAGLADHTYGTHLKENAMQTITFKAIEFDSAGDALQHTEAAGGKAILLDGRNFAMTQDEADRIAAAGVEFAYLVQHEMPDGDWRVMTIPIN
jgi:hypothetical protein